MIEFCQRMNEKIGNLNEADGYDCPICKNRGGSYEVQEHEGNLYTTFVYCKCRNQRRFIRRLNKSGLKNVVEKYTLDNFETAETWKKNIKDTALNYIENGKGCWFYIGGQVGSGKTHICTAMTVELLKKDYQVYYMPWRDTAVKLKSLLNNAEAYEILINEIKNADVLYIDDLFKTGTSNGNANIPTAGDINLAYEILNYRYNNNLPYTIISSEHTFNELTNIEEAISGRLFEKTSKGGWCLSIKRELSRNYRLKKIKEL